MDFFNLSREQHLMLDSLTAGNYKIQGVNDQEDPVDEFDFCPTEVLHDVYLAFCFEQNIALDRIETDRKKFGRFLSEMFDGQRRSRRVAVYDPNTGRRPLRWGYTGIRGPKSMRRYAKAGRPKVSDVADPNKA